MSSSPTYKPKLVVILSRFPYPLEKGDKLRAYYQLKYLAESYAITLITTTDQRVSKHSIDQIRPFCKTIHIFKLSKFSIAFNLILRFFDQKPFQTGYFYSSRINALIQQILIDLKPDHIFCQLIRVSEYVKNYHACPKTIDYMDALSKGIERRIDKVSWYKKWLFQSEAKRLQQYERKIFEYFEHHIIISEQDRELILHPERKKIACIPNGIAPSFFESIEVTKEYDLVFVGNLSYPPNIEAVEYIIDQILPLNKSLTLVVSGANPQSNLVRKLSQHKQVKLTGWVDDIRTAYSSAKLFIAPMLIGTGLQNKLIEAMAIGIPCITTSLANNALKAEPNTHILVADTPQEFMTHIERLLASQSEYEFIQKNALQFVKNQFNWEDTAQQIKHLMKH